MAGSELPLSDVYATIRRALAAPRRRPSTGVREATRQGLISTGPLALSDHAAEEARLGNCPNARAELAHAMFAARHLGGIQGPMRTVLDQNRATVKALCPRGVVVGPGDPRRGRF